MKLYKCDKPALFIFASALILLYFNTAFPKGSGADSLAISATISKHTVKFGEPFQIGCIITNIGRQSVTIRHRIYVHPPSFIKISDAKQNQMEWYPTVFATPSFGRETFVELEPGGQIILGEDAVITKGPLTVISHNKRPPESEVNGVFIDFRGSVIMLNGEGQYSVRCQIDQTTLLEGQREDAKKDFGIKNIWTGEMTSSPVQLKIED